MTDKKLSFIKFRAATKFMIMYKNVKKIQIKDPLTKTKT